jgi:hypothetical protein
MHPAFRLKREKNQEGAATRGEQMTALAKK